LREAVADLNIVREYSETAPYVTISSGVACSRPQQDEQDQKELIRQADEMLYKSKNAGRNQVSGIDLG
jgi:diguanylate cyclase (GGDEF)-like protein